MRATKGDNMKSIKTGVMYRSVELNREAIDTEKRMVDLSFSSEAVIQRFFGSEILDHQTKSVRMDRIRTGAPLLSNHSEHIGVVEKASIKDKRGYATVRFGKSAKASEIFDDVVDGIRTGVSVGYRIHEMITEKVKDGVEVMRALDWEPLEISIVSVPADISVGIGRSEDREFDTLIGGKKVMSEDKKETVKAPVVNIEEVRNEARATEGKRISEILSLGEQHECSDIASAYIKSGKSVDDFRGAILEKKYNATPVETPDPGIGMSDREAGEFSVVRAINAVVEGNWNKAPFEKECSDAVAKHYRKQPQGFFIPREVQTRDLNKTTATAGGHLVATDLLSESFVDLLRNSMVLRQLGATVLGGLVGDVAIPRQTGGATAYWVGESADPTESQQAFDQLALSPNTVGAYTDISRKLLLQSSLDVESLVRSDLATVLALAIDLAGINGSGASNQPTGILNTTGIGDVAGGTNGAAPDWADIVNIWKEVSKDNASFGSLAWLTNSDAIAKLAQTEKASNTAQYIVSALPDQNGLTAIAGVRAGVSNQVPNDLTKGTGSNLSAIIFGNFADLIIAEWGAVDVMVDPFTGGLAGTVRVRVLQDVDVAVRHAESFSAMQDAITT